MTQPASERPRERLAALGPEAVATAELIAILLRTGLKGTNVLQIGQRKCGQGVARGRVGGHRRHAGAVGQRQQPPDLIAASRGQQVPNLDAEVPAERLPPGPERRRHSVLPRVAAIELWRIRRRFPLPYGVAIAVGGMLVVLSLKGS